MRNIIFIFFIFTACSKPPKDYFVGSWFYCDYTGQYSELHISNDNLIFNFNGPNGWYNPHTYQILNDTLTYLDTLHKWVDSLGKPIVVYYNLIVSDNELTYFYGSEDSISYKWTFHRFKNKVEEYQKNDSLSESKFWDLQFYERSSLINCKDQRSDEQKEQDSIRINEMIEGIL